MKHNRILKYLYCLAGGAFLASVTAACSDDLDQPGYVEEGIPVTLAIDYSVGQMPQVSRGDMATGRDKEINSAWVAFFSAADGKLKHSFKYDRLENVSQMDIDYKTLSGLKVTSGTYTIVAVGNPAGNTAILRGGAAKDMMTLLEKDVHTLDDYKAVVVAASAGEVGTPTGNLVMQGIYLPSKDHDKGALSDYWAGNAFSQVVVNPSVTTLPGAIHFRRLISQVKFNIKWDKTKITSFDPVSATIYNVPTYSWLAEREDGAAGNKTTNAGDGVGTTDAFAVSQRFYTFTADVPGNPSTYTIDWYQMENRRRALTSLEPADYAGRELERKNPTGATADGAPTEENTGLYIPLCGNSGDEYSHNNNATYLVLNVRMRMASGPEGATRTVEASYTIHLGYCEGEGAAKAADYNCRRNTKYIYNVTVRDVNKIEVEAKRDNNVDYEHGAEGVITDVTDGFFEADSHYEQFNIQLRDTEREGLKWTIRVYTSQTEFFTIDQNNYRDYDEKYYNWIEFVPNMTSNTSYCATYPGRNASNIYNLTNLATATITGNTGNRFTMFVNEYAYESTADGGQNTPNWKTYVNLPDRTMWLKVEETRSTDGESVIYKSKYAVQQKSMQTYYGTGANNPGQALVLEHVDETGSMTYSAGYAASNSYSYLRNRGGRFQSACNLEMMSDMNTGTLKTAGSRIRWNAYLNPNAYLSGSRGLVAYRDGYKKLSLSCLNRNRDLNGDGRIDPNEMRWFIPNLNQYVRFALGSYSLQTPLYDFSLKAQGTTAEYYHYGSSEGYTLWAEEYTSTLNGNDNIEYVRCARYVGVDMETIPTALPAQPAFEKVTQNGNSYVRFHYGDEASRSTKQTGPLPWHYVNSEYNRPYEAIEYKTTDIDVNAKNPFNDGNQLQMTVNMWFTNINGTNPCDIYNTGGERGWRVPNQVEMAAVLMLDPSSLANGPRYVTMTREYFSQGRIMGTTSDIATAISDTYLQPANGGAYVRCVRDVDL